MSKSDIGDLFKVLTLFFALTVISLVMIFGKFEQGVEDFWEEEEESNQSLTVNSQGADE